MSISKKRALWEQFRESFLDADKYLRSDYVSLGSKISGIAITTLMFNFFLKRYATVLAEEEKEILQKRIDQGIDKLLKLDQRHILCLHYFVKNFRKNPDRTVQRTEHFMISVRTLFEIAPDQVPLESTVWNYFVRDISKFIHQLIPTIKNSKGEMLGRLSFLLLIVIHCLISISKSCLQAKNEKEDSKITELFQKSEESLQESVSCLLDLFETGSLETVLNTSPGFIVYLHRILKEDLTRFGNSVISKLDSVVNRKLQKVDFNAVSQRTKNFFILNAMEFGKDPPTNVVPSGKDALAFLARGFIRFEEGEDFLGALPTKEGAFEEIYVDDIDSFNRVDKIEPNEVKNLVPLGLLEKTIKEHFAEIVGESFVQKDWGGELGDLFTSRVILDGRRIPAAFMFKGRGFMKRLTIADCGKNGDQIIRLLKMPARLFIIQHIWEIDHTVRELLEVMAETKARQTGRKIYYCLLDGVDTARILLAYGKLES